MLVAKVKERAEETRSIEGKISDAALLDWRDFTRRVEQRAKQMQKKGEPGGSSYACNESRIAFELGVADLDRVRRRRKGFELRSV